MGESFGKILATARKEAEMTEVDLAFKLKTSTKLIEQIEKGQRDIGIETASLILKELGYHIVVRKPSTGEKATQEIAKGLAFYYALGRLKEREKDSSEAEWEKKAKVWSDKHFEKYQKDAELVLKTNNLI